jgi:acetyl-CoA acetyltransferase family protein
MEDVVIVDAVRTPIGKRNGSLSTVHAVDLAAGVLAALSKRSDLDTSLIDDVIMGCVVQTGRQGLNIARNALLAAGFTETVPGTTVDRQCGSSQQALHFAAQGIMAGGYDVVIAAGVEHMTSVPMNSTAEPGSPYSERLQQRYDHALVPLDQGRSAESIADKWALGREALDAFSAESHRRAERAQREGRFDREIVPVSVVGSGLVGRDEGVRPGSTVETLAKLKPVFSEGGKVTAGNASQISDGAAAILLMGGRRAEQLGLRPRARVHALALAGVDPITMLTAPIPATQRVLDRGGLSLDQIDLIEMNEAFASVVLAWQAETGADLERVNVNGGAIALGHPLGCSGARLTTTLLHELERSGGRYGLQVMCEGGGMANAMIIERLD